MILYRITLERWADKLVASGKAGRWNSNGVKVIYTASSRSLACLENIVHHNAIDLVGMFRIMVMYVPDDIHFETISIPQLPEGWHGAEPLSYNLCQSFGDRWAASNYSLLLQVPSALVKSEHNFLLNVNHRRFTDISIVDTEPFLFDPRIKK